MRHDRGHTTRFVKWEADGHIPDSAFDCRLATLPQGRAHDAPDARAHHCTRQGWTPLKLTGGVREARADAFGTARHLGWKLEQTLDPFAGRGIEQFAGREVPVKHAPPIREPLTPSPSCSSPSLPGRACTRCATRDVGGCQAFWSEGHIEALDEARHASRSSSNPYSLPSRRRRPAQADRISVG